MSPPPVFHAKSLRFLKQLINLNLLRASACLVSRYGAKTLRLYEAYALGPYMLEFKKGIGFVIIQSPF